MRELRTFCGSHDANYDPALSRLTALLHLAASRCPSYLPHSVGLFRILLQMLETVDRGPGKIADQTRQIGMLPYLFEIIGSKQSLIYSIKRIIGWMQGYIVPLKSHTILENIPHQAL